MECIKPIGEVLGLEDCLACSGCVSVAEPDKEKHERGLQRLLEGGVGLVITPQAKISLFQRVGSFSGFRDFEQALLWVFRKSCVVDSSAGTRALLGQERASLSRPVISSLCPGVVAYAEGSAHHLLPYLSKNRSPVEICAKYLKDKGYTTVISIVMCADKRMESEWDSLVDHALTTTNVFDFFKDKIVPVPNYLPPEHSTSQTLAGSSAGGLYEGLVEGLARGGEGEGGAIVSQIDRENYKEVAFLENGRIRRIAQVHGLPRVVAFSTKAKSRSFLEEYVYVEMMVCKKACLFGPSQGKMTLREEQAYLQLQGPSPGISADLPLRAFTAKTKTKHSFSVQW
ncbi:hypothetical protein NEDG_01402 [Nematocida displodere]|uniref:Iron hydrogenase large subunit C-terminal domain-containing protein n=1 Tax=Nematocida displodere TaxID=1805483 RepID=A0A177EEB1_9MICR|nr:hypothetical protein NEDG_01402 [Nematocida displodere]